MYTAILISGSFVVSRPVAVNDSEAILNYMSTEAGVSLEDIDAILLLQNGQNEPEVVEHWTGQ